MIDVLAWSMFEVPQEISLADTVDVSPRSMYENVHTHYTGYDNYGKHASNACRKGSFLQEGRERREGGDRRKEREREKNI